jgi:hypothetical protein
MTLRFSESTTQGEMARTWSTRVVQSGRDIHSVHVGHVDQHVQHVGHFPNDLTLRAE